MAVANPYFINIQLFWPDGTRPNQNQIARVRAFDVNGAIVTDEGQSGYDTETGGWRPIFMQNIAAFYPPREQPNLRFEVWSTAEQLVHSTQVFASIPSGATVKITIGQSAEIVGSAGSLSLKGDAKLVVHAKTATKEQRYLIEAAQNPGTLAGTLGATYNVTASGEAAWRLRLQQKEGTSFVDRALMMGPTTTQGDLKISFLVPSDNQDITLRLEQAVSQPGGETTYGMIQGTVRQADGQATANATVSAFNRKARGGDTLLGDPVKTGADGAYIIVYKRTKPAYDVYVRAEGDHGVLATSGVVMNAGLKETIALVVGGVSKEPAEYDRNRRALDAALSAEGLQIGDLAQSTDSELALLSARSGLLPADLVLHKQSVTLAQQTGIADDFFFALGRQHVPLSLPAILALDPEARSAALDRAFSANQLAESRRTQAQAALTTLQQLSINEALRNPTLPGESTLAGFLTLAGVAAAKQRTLVESYAAHNGTISEFWEKMRQGGTFTPQEVTATQFSLQLGVLSQNHLPLVQALKSRGVSDLKSLTQFDEGGWLELIRSQVGGRAVGVPPDLTAAGVTEAAYARTLFTVVEDAFPTAMIARSATSFPRPQTLSEFYTRNLSYDVRATTVSGYLRANPAALEFIPDASERAAFIGQLKGMERVYRLAPTGARLSTMKTLINAGIGSASQIYSMGRSSFLDSFGSALGASIADRIFSRATHVAAAAAVLLARYGAAFDRAPFAVTAPRPTDVEGFADYRSLFGSLDFCSCEHCQSALSPAAYLVDVLHWLDTRPKTQSKTPLSVLLQNRRADIATIELACANTNTPLPYLDLVNEILEIEVAPGEGPPVYQTRGDAADLAAHPEHLHTPAYEALAEEVYPFSLPFNLWLDEARTYLEHLGIARHALMEAFAAAGPESALVDVAIARESLALSVEEANVIAAVDPPSTAQEFWGLSGDSGWVSKLRRVPLFLSKAASPLLRDGMPYAELSDLWRTSFVQSEGAVGIWFDGVTCDTKTATLPGLGAAHLARIHRFLRLQRRLGWSAAELDLAIDVLGGGQLDEALLIKLGSVARLKRELGLALPELLSWWGPIDTRRWTTRLVSGVPAGAPSGSEGRGFVFNAELEPVAGSAEQQSLFDRLFLNRSVDADPNPAFHVRSDGAALLDETRSLDSESPAIAAALGISADELSKLAQRLPNASLSLANLSALYRHVSLARALGLDAAALVALLELTGLDPFDPAHPEAAVTFKAEARAVRDSGFAVAELDYLLRHVDTKPQSLEPPAEATGVLLLELRDLLRKVLADNADPQADADADALRERLTRELARFIAPDQAGPLLKLVDLEPGAAAPPGAEALIDATLTSFLNAENAKNALARPASAGYLSKRDERLRFVLAPLVVYRRAQATRATVIEKLSVKLGLDQAVAAPVLEDFIRHPAPGGATMVALFSDPALIGYAQTDENSDAPRVPGPADFPEQFDAYERLHKVALLLSRLRIAKDELDWVFVLGPARGTLNLQALPITEPAPSAVQYAAWRRLREACALRDGVTGGKIFDLFSAAVVASAGDAAVRAEAFELLLGELAKRTRWNREDIEFFAGAPARGATPAKPSALGLAYPRDFEDERALASIDRAMTAVRRIGLAAETLWPWRLVPAALDEQATQASDIKQAVRARLGEARWRESTRPLRDGLREKQRDALAAYLVGKDKYSDVDALFDHLLIDVEMSACQLTSRIKLAISSVQLFVQRAFLNGEPGVRLKDGDAREWKWMKNYRVWEANRKVFLYPENYIEPELRDDKTPFFKELEDELLQGELDDDHVERAVMGYLEKLEDVARLQIAGVCEHVEDETNVVHVFGRTRSAPHRYYHRKWVDKSHWTPWEPVELDIESDQLVPIVHNRRLYLFWPFITETAVEEVVDTPAQGGVQTQKAAEKYLQIRLAWSEQRHGKWAGKKLSQGQIGANDAAYRRLQQALTGSKRLASQIFLVVSKDGADLIIQPIRHVPNLPAFARMDRFRLSGCDGTMALERNTDRSLITLHQPENTTITNQTFASSVLDDGLVIPLRVGSTSAWQDRKTLGTTPTPFSIVPIRQTAAWSGSPFFFEDRQRTFFVVPKPAVRPRVAAPWISRDSVEIDIFRTIDDTFRLPLAERPPIPQPDPRAIDRRSLVGDPISVQLDSPVLHTDVVKSGGVLLDRVATDVLLAFGPTVKTLGSQTLSFQPNQLALSTQTVISTKDGAIFRFASGGKSELGAALRGAQVDAKFDLPAIVGIIPGLIPSFSALLQRPFRFYNFYHPYVCRMRRQLNRFGLDALLDPPADGAAPELVRQSLAQEFFAAEYSPRAVATPYPRDEFDFSYSGAYSAYNWELFFHLPFLVAISLSKSRRFDSALRWFHYVFDPTESDDQPAPQRFWKVRPFFELFYEEDVGAGPIQELLLLLQYDGKDAAKLDAKAGLIAQIEAFSKNPFNPHALARLRPVAYQKAIVLRYIDNLINWGDELFRRDTIESINEATLLYVLAARLLGRRPQQVDVEPPAPRTFNDLRGGLDEFSSALVEIEAHLDGSAPERTGQAENDPPVLGRTLFFCIPPNDKLVTDGWNRVEDRLFKIRHCMNIEGVVRQLPLFEPPIDPALLVRATAAGIDLGSVLNDVNGSLPLQRYAVLGQRAQELANDVRGLGQALLSALEKKDAEALSLLRSEQEIRLLNATTQVRQQQTDEAKAQLENLQRSRELADIRLRYYRGRQFMNAAEKTQFALMVGAGVLDLAGGVVNLFAAAASALPDIEVGAAGFGGSPLFTTKIGGGTVSNVTGKVAEGLKVGASALDRAGSLSGLLGSHERRQDEWDFLGDQAQKEIEQIDRQIVAAEIRLAITEKELDNHRLQIEQAREVEEFLRSKFSNTELYSWMIGQLSSLYFQSYQLAYDVARRAERAWQFELAQPDKTFVQFGYWDGLKKGLLAGDRLHFDIQRMATSYLDENRREYELTRHVSLRLLDPLALIRLRREGQCFVRIPEAWFDLDSPGHYLRRLKTVSVTVPSVTGPYVPVRLTLTLVSSSMRTTPDANGPYGRRGDDDSRFRDNVVGIQSIVTSGAQADAGLFETNLRDERYLPFEGAGAISEWRLELPNQFRQFDYTTISDVVLHLRYTARQGGALLKDAAEKQLGETLRQLVLPSLEARPNGEREGMLQLVSLASDQPDAWHRFLNPGDSEPTQNLAIDIAPEVFPFGFAGPGLGVAGCDLFLVVADSAGYASGTPVRLRLAPPSGAANTVELTSTSEFGGIPHAAVSYGNTTPKPTGRYTIVFDEAENTGVAPGLLETVSGRRRLNPAVIRDLYVAVRFKV